MSNSYFFNQTSNFFYNSPYPTATYSQQYNQPQFFSEPYQSSFYQQPPTPPSDHADSFYFGQKYFDYPAPAQNFGKNQQNWNNFGWKIIITDFLFFEFSSR